MHFRGLLRRFKNRPKIPCPMRSHPGRAASQDYSVVHLPYDYPLALPISTWCSMAPFSLAFSIAVVKVSSQTSKGYDSFLLSFQGCLSRKLLLKQSSSLLPTDGCPRETSMRSSDCLGVSRTEALL